LYENLLLELLKESTLQMHSTGINFFATPGDEAIPAPNLLEAELAR
jgi:hypothetical protein